jgi:aminoglycoside 6'-N-acetyltransferase
MHKLLLDIPTQFETERLLVRCYQPGDGKWYYDVSLRNREHLSRYETGNVLNTLRNEVDAETVIRDFVTRWLAHECFFLGAFEKATGEFAAQIYVGVVNWDLPEFELGYIADVDHEGQGYVTEAARGALRFIFNHLHAHRVRLECDDTNTRSYRVAERCGMALEGHIRENKRHADGSISGTLHYGLLRSEFERLNK